MKICAVQARSVKGDIAANIINHMRLLDLAISQGADVIIFPELSLTGYEPELAKNLATTIDDERFNDFQIVSNNKKVTIGVGMPTKDEKGVSISMILFQPNKPRKIYSKKYIHPDEEPFFIHGENFSSLKLGKTNVALAICYELSIPDHSEEAFKSGAEVYIASVAKTAKGVENAITTLSGVAKKYAMTVLMSNCIGPCDNFESAGKSSAWSKQGVLKGQLDGSNEGILVIDTDTQETIEENV